MAAEMRVCSLGILEEWYVWQKREGVSVKRGARRGRRQRALRRARTINPVTSTPQGPVQCIACRGRGIKGEGTEASENTCERGQARARARARASKRETQRLPNWNSAFPPDGSVP